MRVRRHGVLSAGGVSLVNPACLIEPLEVRQLLSASVSFSALANLIASTDLEVYRQSAGQSAASTSLPSSALTAQQIRSAYGINSISIPNVSSSNGAGVTIAIVDAYSDPNALADLQAFDAAMGLSDPSSFKQVNETGGSTLPGTDPSAKAHSGSSTWELEEMLDIEWVHAIAPAANLVLVAASSASLSDLFTAVNTAKSLASVVSLSWGSSQEFSSETSYDSVFTSPTDHNVTFLVASGDSGAPASYPATSPNVVSVGGTTLKTDSSGDYLGESGWSESGGSLSTYETQPAYQSGVVKQSTTRRAAPDVAMDADPATGVAVYDSYDGSTTGGSWFRVGGTSLATPMWAGLVALVDQARIANGLSAYDGATGLLPRLYSLSSSDFHDITSGNNGYSASAGYDLVTGLGSPKAATLVLDLANLSSTSTPTPTAGTPVVASLTASPSPATAGQAITLSASGVAESGGTGTITQVAFYEESNGTAGFQSGTSADTLLGTATRASATGTWTFTLASGLDAGSYTFYAVATDAAGAASAAVAASETVNAAPVSTAALTVSPAPATAGRSITLTATGMGALSSATSEVAFFIESNGVSGLQSGARGDVLLGVVTRPGASGAWTLQLAQGLPVGSYVLYAAAVSNRGLLSNIVSATETVVAPPAPTIGTLTANPSSVSTNQNFTLSVAGVSAGAVEVALYEETDGVAGLQRGSGGDYLIGYARRSPSGTWSLAVNSGTATGTQTVYAVADDGISYSNVASTTVTVTARTTSAASTAAVATSPWSQTPIAGSAEASDPLLGWNWYKRHAGVAAAATGRMSL